MVVWFLPPTAGHLRSGEKNAARPAAAGREAFPVVSNQPRFFQNGMGSLFVDGLDGAGGEGQGNCFLQLRDVNFFLLQIRVTAKGAARIELGSAGAVAVATAKLGFFVGNRTGFHIILLVAGRYVIILSANLANCQYGFYFLDNNSGVLGGDS